MTRIPYLQAQGTNTMTVCWHDVAQTGTRVKYGIDSALLNKVVTGTSEIISEPFRWHSVKLIDLHANTRYFYRVSSGNAESGIYSFKTLPDSTYSGKLRFVIFGDTHASDTTMAGKVQRATRSKISELYGPDIENHVNGIFHSGDIVVSGSTPGQYTMQYFKPLSALSANIPTMVVAGNHEIESPYFYQYLKLDSQSAFPQVPDLNEKIWQLKVGNSLFIGMNTNIIDQYGTTQVNWLDTRLNQAETDTTIDFVFLFFHHPPISELWIVGGTDYVNNRLIPVCKKYTKVRQMHYGHTHGFERGTITSGKPDGDIRIVCGGGGGGHLDPWVEGENLDYNDIQICISNYFFQILEIDIANHSYQNSVYSLGTLNDPKNSELIDVWHKSKKQANPATPVIENIVWSNETVQFNTSKFSGIDSIMSVQFQVIDSSQSLQVIIDSIIHRMNIYGIDQNSVPIDLNQNINLYQSKIDILKLSTAKNYFFRVRYRDQNLKWSNWSGLTAFQTTGIHGVIEQLQNNYLRQNYPNPFQYKTTIAYEIPEETEVVFRIYNSENRLLDEINQGIKTKGIYNFTYRNVGAGSDIFIYRMVTDKFMAEKKMVKMK